MPRIDSYLRPEATLGNLGVDENLMSEEFWHTLREASPALCLWGAHVVLVREPSAPCHPAGPKCYE